MIEPTSYAGIDYGMGLVNIDKETGIHYGVISAHDLNEWVYESFEADYGPPTCGECGVEAVDYDDEKHGDYKVSRGCCTDYACEDCETVFDGQEAFGDEPIGSYLDDGEYKAELHSDNDIFILKSPYFTYAQFCSPCAPGAGHLGHPCPDGPKTYCFGDDWFDGNKAPYPVYDVKTGERVGGTDMGPKKGVGDE